MSASGYDPVDEEEFSRSLRFGACVAAGFIGVWFVGNFLYNLYNYSKSENSCCNMIKDGSSDQMKAVFKQLREASSKQFVKIPFYITSLDRSSHKGRLVVYDIASGSFTKGNFVLENNDLNLDLNTIYIGKFHKESDSRVVLMEAQLSQDYIAHRNAKDSQLRADLKKLNASQVNAGAPFYLVDLDKTNRKAEVIIYNHINGKFVRGHLPLGDENIDLEPKKSYTGQIFQKGTNGVVLKNIAPIEEDVSYQNTPFNQTHQMQSSAHQKVVSSQNQEIQFQVLAKDETNDKIKALIYRQDEHGAVSYELADLTANGMMSFLNQEAVYQGVVDQNNALVSMGTQESQIEIKKHRFQVLGLDAQQAKVVLWGDTFKDFKIDVIMFNDENVSLKVNQVYQGQFIETQNGILKLKEAEPQQKTVSYQQTRVNQSIYERSIVRA